MSECGGTVGTVVAGWWTGRVQDGGDRGARVRRVPCDVMSEIQSDDWIGRGRGTSDGVSLIMIFVRVVSSIDHTFRYKIHHVICRHHSIARPQTHVTLRESE